VGTCGLSIWLKTALAFVASVARCGPCMCTFQTKSHNKKSVFERRSSAWAHHPAPADVASAGGPPKPTLAGISRCLASMRIRALRFTCIVRTLTGTPKVALLAAMLEASVHACSRHRTPSMRANLRAAAVFTARPLPPMRANRRAAAVFTARPLPPVRALRWLCASEVRIDMCLDQSGLLCPFIAI
jgi:hypothetical protein